MTRPGRYFQPPLLIMFVVFMAVSAAAPTFYAGIVSETDVSRNIISDRWMGVSGTVERGNSSLSDFKVGSLKMNSNQTGEVLSAEIEGIKGGGYYLVFLPTNESMDPSNLENISNTDLEKDGIFSENLFPGFYPEYSERFDSPEQTFTDFRNLTVDGKTFNASYADLSGSTDMHVLKYDNGTDEYPAFISPIDGRSSGSSFDTCYLSGCNFQALLPRLGTGNFSYSANLISRGSAVQGCGSPSGDTSLLVDTGEGTDCIQVQEDNVVFDMYNSVVESEDGCAVSMSADNSLLRDFKVVNSDTGICASDANSKVTDANISDVGIAVEAQNSELDLEDLDISSGGAGLALQGSDADLQNVNLSGTGIYGEASSVSIQSYQDPLPVPEDAQSIEQPVGSRVEIDSLTEGDESYVENLGLGYPDINQSGLQPVSVYKYDLSNSSFTSEEFNVSLRNPAAPSRFAEINQNVTDFSIFSLYGIDIDGDESSAGEGDEGESESGGAGGSGGGGSDEGGTGGGGTAFTGAVALGAESFAEDSSTALGYMSNSGAEGALALGQYANAPNPYEATFGNLNGEELDLNVTGNATVHGSGGLNVTSGDVVADDVVSRSGADLAEVYSAERDYEPGTVVTVSSGDADVEAASRFEDVAGVVSTDPGFTLNSGEEGVEVALEGRVPVKVAESVEKGDDLAAGSNGEAVSCETSDVSLGENASRSEIVDAVNSLSSNQECLSASFGEALSDSEDGMVEVMLD